MLLRASHAQPRHRGFSLVEVVVVVAIIGILASLASTSLSEAARRSRAATELREVEAFISRAGPLARMRRECVQAVVDTGGHHIDLTLHPHGPAGCDFSAASPRAPQALRFPPTGESPTTFTAARTLRVDRTGTLLDSAIPYSLTAATTLKGIAATFTVSQGTAAVRRQQ